MHNLLEVKWKVIAVTTERATIKAKLENGEIIEKQDRISNVADYDSPITSLELADSSLEAKTYKYVTKTIEESDFIILWPGDLYTSVIANLIIWWIKESIKNSNAKLVFVMNNTNKWWETNWFVAKDFVDVIEKYLWRKIDYLVANNKKPSLNETQIVELKKNISVKWWDFVFITKEERREFEERWIQIFETDLVDKDTLYKHDKKNTVAILQRIFKKNKS